MSQAFDLLSHSLEKGYTLVEASAGTGKTYSITWLVIRLLLEEELETEELLVVTFTIAATEELNSRIRVHINEVLASWPLSDEEAVQASPELRLLYGRLNELQRADAPKRLQRALDQFDLAQISTIHGFCGQLLRDFPLESGIEVGAVQTHLTPLFEEIAEDFRSIVISQASRPALRLMSVLSKKLKHDTEQLISICKHLEPEGWAAVYCDPLSLPINPTQPPHEKLVQLSTESQTSTLPPPPPVFLEDQEDQEDHETLVEDELFPQPIKISADVWPEHVIGAWDYIGQLFDHTIHLRLIPAIKNREWRQSLFDALTDMNAHAVWKANGGPNSQSGGWEAIESILELLKEGRSPIAPVIALHVNLGKLSTSGLTSALNRTKKKVNEPYFDFSHPLSDVLDELVTLMAEVSKSMGAWFRWGFAVYAQKELTKRKQAEGWISTNDLVRLTHAALNRPNGTFLERARERFGAALIDEFQDTDPMQWGIFSQILSPEHSRAITYLIGDPKQSIYRFRGADLNAYLAVKLGISADRAFTMSRNFRSDPRVLDALNQHFDPRQESHMLNHWSKIPAGEDSKGEGFFLDEQVPYVHVDGGRPNRASSFPALRWRYFELDLVTKRDEKLAEYLAEDVSRFLAQNHLIGSEGKQRVVALDDIGILTRTNAFAIQVSVALAKRGIASTIRGDGDVFKTEAIAQLERLMRAMLMPEDDRALKAGLAIDLLGFDALMVRESAETIKTFFSRLHGIWVEQGFAAAFHALLHGDELNLIEQTLQWPDGARDLSRMIHAAERIQARESLLGLSPELTLQWLRERRLEVDVEPTEEDQVRPHIDTAAVQVVTVHRSKGLEYPILFCPDLWCVSATRSGGICVTEPEVPGGLRALDLRVEKSEQRSDIEAKIVEAGLREERRLLYVALTRAVHHCSIYLSVSKTKFRDSPLYPMFMGAVTLPKKNPKRPEYDRMIEDRGGLRYIQAQKEVVFEIERREPKLTVWRGATEDAKPLVVHQTPQPSNPAWRISSFTSLAHLAEAKRERLLLLEDIPELDEATHGKVLAPLVYNGPQPPLIDLTGSARFGQCIHSLLERLDFQNISEAELEKLTEILLNAWGFDRRFAGRVALGIWQALHTPLASPEPDHTEGAWVKKSWQSYNLDFFCLRHLARAQKRQEVQFDLPLATTDNVLSAKILNQILRLDPACKGLPSLPDDLDLQGFLKGSIDLMFRVSQNGEERYYIADYKTHWLGDENGSQLGHYHPSALQEVMNKQYYHLQSHLYQVVLHRLLSQRLQDLYQPEKHFGGSYYLFLRGMAGTESRINTPEKDDGCAGVYFHRPVLLVTDLLSLALSDPKAASEKLRSLGLFTG